MDATVSYYLKNALILPLLRTPAANEEGLRVMDADYGPGVHGLFSDTDASLIAFAFDPGRYDEKSAKAWISEALTKGAESVAAQAGGKPKKPAIQARSFDETRRLVENALTQKYNPGYSPELSDGAMNTNLVYIWIEDMNGSTVVYSAAGSDRYVMTYSINAEGAVEFLGEPEKVAHGWKRISDGTPVMMHSFTARLFGDAEDAGETDGVWKEIVREGAWYKTDTGKRVEVTADIIDAVIAAQQAGLPRYISVPADNHHGETGGIVPPASNTGFVTKLKKVMTDGIARLFAQFDIRKADIAAGIQDGTIADVSVYIQPSVIHPATGKMFDWVLQHVLLTNNPLVQELAPFGIAAAGNSEGQPGSPLVVRYWKEETTVTNSTTPTAPAQQPAGVMLSAADMALFEQLKAQNSAVAQKARNLEITRSVRALEGKEAHPDIIQIAGYVHYPVVVAAAEEYLKTAPQALALSANGDGATPADAALFKVLNAIPKEGRMPVAGAATPPPPESSNRAQNPNQVPDIAAQQNEQQPGKPLTDEQIDGLVALLK